MPRSQTPSRIRIASTALVVVAAIASLSVGLAVGPSNAPAALVATTSCALAVFLLLMEGDKQRELSQGASTLRLLEIAPWSVQGNILETDKQWLEHHGIEPFKDLQDFLSRLKESERKKLDVAFTKSNFFSIILDTSTDQHFRIWGVVGHRDNGHPVVLEGLIEEVTEEIENKTLERMEVDRLRSGALASKCAHDLRPWLQTIESKATELLKQARTPKVLEELGELRDTTRRALQFIRRLSTTAGHRRHITEKCYLQSMLERTQALIRLFLPSTCNFEVSIDPGNATLHGEELALSSLIFLLALNARDAMPQGGTLRLEAMLSQTHVEITLSDTGHGIDPADLNHVFEPFFTTRNVALDHGLGLTMAYGLAHAHDGTLKLESDGEGTTAILRLPVKDVTTDSPTLAQPALARSASKSAWFFSNQISEEISQAFESIGYSLELCQVLPLFGTAPDFMLIDADAVDDPTALYSVLRLRFPGAPALVLSSRPREAVSDSQSYLPVFTLESSQIDPLTLNSALHAAEDLCKQDLLPLDGHRSHFVLSLRPEIR